MMRRVFMVVIAGLLCAGPLLAQGPEMRREQLRQQVMQRFMENVRTQAGLTDEQMGRVREVLQASMEARAGLAQREMQAWRALEGEMRPGVAADADRLERELEALAAIQEERGSLARQDQARLAAFLGPVQRAQVTIAMRRFQMSIDRIRGNRGPPPRGGR